MQAGTEDSVAVVSCVAAEELARRPSRTPDYAAENRALVALARALASDPQSILQTLSETALELCRAHSAGFSLLTEDGSRFEWTAISGEWARHVGGGTPRDFGPCGMVLDRDAPMLFSHPEHDFPYLAAATPPIDEGLLLPFYVAGKAVGTLWVISHAASRRFDLEDLRLMTSLAGFASAAYQASRDSERRFRESAEWLEVALEAGRMGSWEWHVAENRVVWSPALEALHGLEPGSFPGTFDAYQRDIHPDDREHVRRTIEASLSGDGTHQLEYRIVRPDGAERWVEGRGRVFRDEHGRVARLMGVCADITERKRAERAIRESEERLRAIVGATPECVKTVARDGTLLQMNAAGLAMIGAARPEQAFGRSIYDLIAPEDRARFREFNEAVCRGRGGRLEFDLVALDGRRRHMQTHAVPLAQPDGTLAQLAITRDVTEQRRAEEALRAAAEFNRSIIESSTDCIKVLDLEGRLLMMAEGGQRLLCIEDIRPYLDASWIDFWQGEDREAARAAVQAAAAGASGRFIGLFRALDGSDKWWDVSITPILGAEGRPEKLLAVSRDVTERKAAEQALRAGEARLEAELADSRRLQEVSAELLREADPQALYEKIVDAAQAIMRSEFASMQMLYPERAPGGELRLLAFRGFSAEAATFWEWVRADSRSTCGEALRTGRRSIAPDVERCAFMAGSDDLATYLQTGIRAVQTTPLVSRDGKVVGMISTHWRAPHQPSERQLRLLDVLARQAADLMDNARLHEQRAKLVAELQEADRRKDEFIATLSHELRNPLAPLKNALQVLELSHGGDARLAPLRQMMERQVNHLVRLVDDLLEMSRISRGALELRRERVAVSAVVRSALETSQPLIRGAAHQLSLELPGEALWLDGDPVRLAQIIANLLNNAAKYTEPGGRIAVSARRSEGRLELTVRDSGIGIPADVLPRLFEMFSRGGGADRSGQGGLGVGLALARRLAEMHGGTLVAASEGAGRGAEFTLTLPLAASPEEPAASGAPGAQAAPPPRRILIVDDNRDAAQSLGLVLKYLGADVQVAHDGAQALEALRAYEPGVVFLDIGMPGMDGYEVARRIRAQALARPPAIVALTGWGQAQDRRRAREAGFDHHLVKPADLGQLQALLAALDESRRLH